MDCQELLNVIYICFTIYRTGSISPFIIMGIATICWTHKYVTNTLPMLSYLIFTTALWEIFIPISLMQNWDTERSSDLAKIDLFIWKQSKDARLSVPGKVWLRWWLTRQGGSKTLWLTFVSTHGSQACHFSSGMEEPVLTRTWPRAGEAQWEGHPPSQTRVLLPKGIVSC